MGPEERPEQKQNSFIPLMLPEEVSHELTLGAGSPAPASLSCGCGLLWLHNEVSGFEMPQDKRGSSSQGQAYLPDDQRKNSHYFYIETPCLCYEVGSKSHINCKHFKKF